jgi:hypothetical protein
MQTGLGDILKGALKFLLIIGLPIAACIPYYRKLSVFYANDTIFRSKMDSLYGSAERPNVIFLGSSRALNTIDPRVIDSVCGTDSYNLGLDGINITEMRMLMRVCIEVKKTPNAFVVNIDPSSFNVNDPAFEFPDILTYAQKDTVVYHAMAEAQAVYACKWKYPFYRWQKLAAVNDGFKVGAFFMNDSGLRRTIDSDTSLSGPLYKGFLPKYSSYRETYVDPFRLKFQEKGFELLRDMIRTCREKGIRMILVTAPMLAGYRKTFLNCDEILAKVSLVAGREGIAYFNMIDDSLSKRKDNFFNFVHLNGWAAERYSLELARKLKDIDVTGDERRPSHP